jgi:hypothetical protein
LSVIPVIIEWCYAENMKKILWGIAGVFVILIAMGIYGFVSGKFEPLLKKNQSVATQSGQNRSQPTRETRRNNCTKNPQPVFSTSFTDTTKINSLAPIGGITVGSPARSYIAIKNEGGKAPLVPIYAPTDAVLEGIVFARRNPDDPNAPGEYRLDFRASCEVTFHFDHLDSLSDTLKSHAPTEPANHTREAKSVSVAVKAGDLLAYTNGTGMAGTFDFYLLNTDKQVPHINPKRWKWEQTTIADCPYGYFAENLKTQYYAMLRSQDGSVVDPLSCGSPSHDIAGTASGGWFQGESIDQEKWLEVGNINGRGEINIREAASPTPFMIRDYKPKITPDKIRVGQTACYSDGNNWAYLRLDSESQITFAKGSGACPSTFPVDSIEIWVR